VVLSKIQEKNETIEGGVLFPNEEEPNFHIEARQEGEKGLLILIILKEVLFDKKKSSTTLYFVFNLSFSILSGK